ncbi:MAG: PRC-barrel domain-containing protein [Hyphomicrobiaceae bacterium]|nr:PRC-barrel domain-containing protein [Hyphomicrobiaceae bacterium]
MKKTVASALALGLIVATPAFAQQAPTAQTIFIDAQSETEYLAKDLLIGAKVQNDEGKIIGDIEDLVLNDWNRVEGVVMGTGGFLGVAEKKVGIRLSALKFTEKDGKTVVSLPGITSEMLKDHEAFKRAKPKKSILERAMEKAKELTDKGSVTAKDAYEKAKEQAGPAYERAKEAAKETYEQAKDAVKGTVDKAKEGAAPGTTPATPGQQ